MSWFTNAYLQFFIDLAANNNTVWFNENRRTYELEVKEPFARFTNEMIKRIQQHEPAIAIKPSEAIMRINNDIRFSKDKSPYKLHMCANISVYGKKNLGFPGFFFQLSPENITLYGGVYMVDNPTLLKIREYILEHHHGLHAAYTGADFIERFGTIQGEQHKRLPKPFTEFQTVEPLIAHKQFYYGATLPAETILLPELPDRLMEYYQAGLEVNRFFQAAMSR
jgi:uncharacterized protein (TIGR02453 family)